MTVMKGKIVRVYFNSLDITDSVISVGTDFVMSGVDQTRLILRGKPDIHEKRDGSVEVHVDFPPYGRAS